MGNCSSVDHNHRILNNTSPQIYTYQDIQNNNNKQNLEDINNSNSNIPIPETQEVYKISRKRKDAKNNLFKRNFVRVNSNTDNSTYSKSKNTTTGLSENNFSQNSFSQYNKFNLNSRIKTIKEGKSIDSNSLTDFEYNSHFDKYEKKIDNKTFNEIKKKNKKKNSFK